MKERKRKLTLGSRSSKGRTFLGWVDSTSSPFLVHVQCLKDCILRLDGMGSTQSERDFCAATLTRLAKTMNLLRLSRANEPQSGVGRKFIFCAGSGLVLPRSVGQSARQRRQWHFARVAILN